MKQDILSRIIYAWNEENKEEFKSSVGHAFNKKICIDEILETLRNNRNIINEDFEVWAYRYVTTEGMSECAPG